MLIIMSIFLATAFIALILALLALVLGKKSNSDREKLTAFECGFDSNKKARAPFSLRFFTVTIIFLIFDVEIALLLPAGLLSCYSDIPMILLTVLILILILILGLIHEWNQGALTWVT
uniref:NADH-ubiquinone oxidoreductase chain 3 n=1 Tax=Gammarus pisinnus TaxID=1486748 RepID=A0A517LS56_9CRUS|nr:NADH dehydrogenase subunit 3 [Gammarus pisinnus]QDS78469.1 NADH dehydrogenase subunit 3 [Gammarus pisinnus]